MLTKQEAKQKVREAELNLRNAQWNLYFASLNAAEKRVAIAKDVLAQLKLGTIKSTPGTYTEATVDANGNLQKCEACALGALFTCATVRQAVEGSVEDMDLADPEEMHAKLAPYFDVVQLKMIENAYEKASIQYADDWGSAGPMNDPSVLKFNKGVRSKRERMERIMKNIIRNHGTFKP